VDDRTEDCAFGAMMSPAVRRKFRKLRFQMIADNGTGGGAEGASFTAICNHPT